MYRFFSRILPSKIQLKYRELLKYSDIKIPPDRFIGFIIIYGLIFSLAISFYLAFLAKTPILIMWPVLFIGLEILAYNWLLLSVNKRTRFVESVLPDVLQLMASNLKAGLTVDQALLSSTRPEFGILKDEINRIGKEIATGKEIEIALKHMSRRIKSEKLDKTVSLISSGLKSGGELASLLDQTAVNLRDQKFVEDKVKSNVLMYVIFIFIAISIGAPLLFGLSSFLIGVLTDIMSGITIPAEATARMNLPLAVTEVSISTSFIIRYAIVSLITTSILGSLVLGLISKGKEKEGIKFIPALILLTVVVFFLVRTVIKNVLGGLFGF